MFAGTERVGDNLLVQMMRSKDINDVDRIVFQQFSVIPVYLRGVPLGRALFGAVGARIANGDDVGAVVCEIALGVEPRYLAASDYPDPEPLCHCSFPLGADLIL